MSVAPRAAEMVRFVINGVVAACVHYAALSFNLQVLEMPSAGLANLFAAWFGIAASFIGSRYFVFRQYEGDLAGQAMRFVTSYAVIACFHGLFLFVWTDQFRLDYRLGLILGAGAQAVLSYLGNRLLVFRLA